jgi:hypothetical protein
MQKIFDKLIKYKDTEDKIINHIIRLIEESPLNAIQLSTTIVEKYSNSSSVESWRVRLSRVRHQKQNITALQLIQIISVFDNYEVNLKTVSDLIRFARGDRSQNVFARILSETYGDCSIGSYKQRITRYETGRACPDAISFLKILYKKY